MSDDSIIPAGWVACHLEDLVLNPKADLVDGPFGSNLKSHEYVESGIPVLKIQNIKANRFVRKQLSYVTAQKAAELSRHSFVAGDLVITKLGEPLGLCCAVPPDLKHGVIVADLMRLRPSPKVIYKPFLLHAINSVVVQVQFKEITKGTTRQRVNLSIVRSIKIALPPLAEQHRIAAKLDELFSELDKGIENLKLAQAQLTVYRQALLKHAFEGKLTAAWRAKQLKTKNSKLETGTELLARMLTERRKNWKGRGKYAEPDKPKTDELGELPSQWVWVSPEQLSSADNYSLAIGPFGSNLKVSDYTTSGVPLVFVRNIRANQFGSDRARCVSVTKAEELRAHSITGGDILVTKMGEPPGDAAIYPKSEPDAVITADCIKLRLSPLLLQPRFFLHMIMSAAFQQQIAKITSGVAQKKVSLGRFSTLALPLPPLNEQGEILAELDAQISAIDSLESDIETNLQKAEALRQSILKKAFAGELVPQDPADEPAAELLKRIRAERESATAKTNSKSGRTALPRRPSPKQGVPRP